MCGWARGAGLPQPRDPLTTRSQGLWPCNKVQLGTTRRCSDIAALILPTATLKQHLQADETMRWWATLSWRWTITSCYQQQCTCLLIHHICKSHIPRNKAKILLLVYASKFWEGHTKVIAFVCAWTHKLTPGTLFMAEGSFTRRGESSKHTYPDFDVSPTCLHTVPAPCVLWLPKPSPPPPHSAAFILPQQQHHEKKGGEKKGEKEK